MVVVVALGKTGDGKSSLLNALLGQQRFHARASTHSVTKSAEQATGSWRQTQITAVDTPGFADSDNSDETHLRNFVQWFRDSLRGCNVFVLVFKVLDVRLDANVQNMLRTFTRLLTPKMWEHVIIVFTHCDFGGESIWREKKEALSGGFISSLRKLIPEIPTHVTPPLYFVSTVPDQVHVGPMEAEYVRMVQRMTTMGHFAGNTIQHVVHKVVYNDDSDDDCVVM